MCVCVCVYVCMCVCVCVCVWVPFPVESINNFIGLGFSGYNEEGKPVWDVCKNVRPWDVEVTIMSPWCSGYYHSKCSLALTSELL